MDGTELSVGFVGLYAGQIHSVMEGQSNLCSSHLLLGDLCLGGIHNGVLRGIKGPCCGFSLVYHENKGIALHSISKQSIFITSVVFWPSCF